MMAILMLFLAAGVCAAAMKRRIGEVLPVLVALMMLLLYGISILGYLSRAGLAAGLFFLVLLLGVGVVWRKNLKKLGIRGIAKQYIDIELAVYLILCILVLILFRMHRVTNWDDLNYWAIFPRNMYEINGFPTGSNSCTLFKDYSPIVQILYFFGFQSIGKFSESLMFSINSILLYTFLLPFFGWNRKEWKRSILLCLTGILFPAVAMFQQFHCLGVDCIMGILFGYLIYSIFDAKERDIFYYIRIAVVASLFILTKSAAVLFVVITFFLLLASWERLSVKKAALSVAVYLPALASYFSWIIFCKIRGNYSYLTERVTANVQNPGQMIFPSYTSSTIREFFYQCIRMPLNDGRIGLSPVMILILFLATAFMMTENERLGKGEKRAVVILNIGLVIYLASLIYMYLFVFDPWEAESLSSFDRYIGIYLVGLLYISLFVAAKNLPEVRFVPILLVCILTLNYDLLSESFSPVRYEQENHNLIEEREQWEATFRTLREEHPEIANRRILLWSSDENQGRDKFAQYAAVPNVTDVYAGEKEGAYEKARERRMDYIYQMESNSLTKVE